MRKLFWSCAAVAVAAAGTVYLAAKHVDQHPYAVMGQTVRAMCGAELEHGSASPAGESAVPAEPAPADPSLHGASTPPAHGQIVAVAESSLPNHIVVGEGDAGSPMSSTGSSPAETTKVDPDALPGCAPMQPSCPLVMPYCCDESCPPKRMPYADEECCERGDEQGCEEESKGFIETLIGFFWNMVPVEQKADPMPAGSEPMAPPDKDLSWPFSTPQEDEHYHDHYPSCPYTGRTYDPNPMPSPAVPDVPQEKKGEEKVCPKKDKVEEPPPQKSSTPEEQEEMSVPEFHLDTMEFRPSDAGLHRFIPGVL